MKKPDPKSLPVIGWREWVALPELGVDKVKAKIDTGARSSSLHAFDMKVFEQDGKSFVRFKVHPLQRSSRETIEVEAPVLEFRKVRSSSGHAKQRPVIVTTVEALGQSWPIELTLANRDEMGFRMLLGREAVRGRMLVDAGASYYGGKPPSAKRKTTKKKKKKKAKPSGKQRKEEP
ncbi:ATP-dependent zinc protease [Aeoliella sp.]|uniref:ATP-dependent zinc protease family protein n=1 Tax=Aeoliella sp. TaxID=2795800 RepID=UPI003CCBA34D